MSARHIYDAIVSAASAEEAIAIAVESRPPGSEVVSTEATDVSSEEGADSWKVVVRFKPAPKLT